ncbi:hypothetical protein BDP27DRAFT_1423776 [Rhodocollybia butyracea]|uniref:Uncharacterized protein n=1 Tax=Rhodocollybia butyracea TaxID=206335 RepID=A0A9P5PR91_9AGAR|nr:hypothetical protein BDP27DRAFT_1423776 [Rhodocollybia butyracea]
MTITLMNSSSLSLEQLSAIAALPDDQCIALAQEQNFAAVPAYLQHSSDPASRQSMTNNKAPGRPLTLALCPQSMCVSTAGPSSIHSSTSVACISVTNEIEFIKENEKAPPPFISLGGVKDTTRVQTLKDKIKELLDCHEGAQRKAPITVAMHKFLDNEENAIALGSTLDAVASMHCHSADETASASVVRREKEKKKTKDRKFIAQASLTTMTHKALDEKAELINLSLDSENNPVKEDNSDIEMKVTQYDDAPSSSTTNKKPNVKKENKSPKAKVKVLKSKKIVAKSRVRKRSHHDDSNIFSEMQTSMAQSMKLHKRIVDNIEESNRKTEVFQDKFLDIFAHMVDK